jgi:NhaA family Na+:H+ antiporter
MVAPAAIYLSLQFGMPGERGWGIPMATDIAFVVGCMAILGSRMHHGLRVLLLSLAIADDIGAILVIAIGYTESIDLIALLLALGGVVVIFGLSKIGVRSLLVYFLLGFFVWLGFHQSGVHGTLAGVVLGLLTPTGSYVSPGVFGEFLQRISEVFHGGAWDNQAERGAKVLRFRRAVRETVPPADYLEALLHPWVSFVIVPLFALANAGVPLELQYVRDSIAWAVAAGLVVGKPLGILLFSWLAIRLRLASLPEGVDWGTLLGGGFLAGIGFTMAVFIASLALPSDLLDSAKVGILGASAVAALIGLFLLSRLLPSEAEEARR